MSRRKTTPGFEPLAEHVAPFWHRLQDQLIECWPTPCANDPGFTDDDPPNEVLALCQYCPTLDACRAFADTFQPTAGVWAGERWPRRQRTRQDRPDTNPDQKENTHV